MTGPRTRAMPTLPGDWRFHASCDPNTAESFFPTTGQHSPVTKATCAACLVETACGDWALAHGERYGIWGGMTEHERRPLLRAARARP